MNKNIITLPNGITLNPKGGWAEDIDKKAKSRLGSNYRAFLATEPDGTKSYLLVKDSEPIYENQSFEAMCCHIEMLRMAENFN